MLETNETTNTLRHWAFIPDYLDYLISRDGRIITFKYGEPRYITPFRQSDGYLQVHLYSGDTSKRFYVHRLVLSIFDTPPPTDERGESYVAHHIDHVRDHNRLENLQWLPRAVNSAIQKRSNDNTPPQTQTASHTSDTSYAGIWVMTV